MLNKDKRTYIAWGLTALAVITASLLISFLINRFSAVQAFFSFIINILKPVIYGGVMTFLTAPLFNRMAVRLDRLFNHGKPRKEPGSLARGISTAACAFMIIAIITAALALLIPSIVSSVTDIINRLSQFTGSVEDFLNLLFRGEHKDVQQVILRLYEQGTTYVINWYQDEFRPNMTLYLSSISVGVVKVFSFLKDFIIGLIIMVYLLNIKNSLSADMKRFLYSVLPVRKANAVIEESRYVKNVFSHFIVGKLIDSLIIGILCYIILLIMRMPYATVISVFVGITNVIPYFGPFIGAIPCAFILLLVSPVDMLKFLIFILILQQFDGNILGPKIMSQTTGVSSFWVLFSILFFGGLWGIVGMIIGIPTFAVISRRVNRFINERLEKKNLPTETEVYMNLESVGFGDHHFVYKPTSPEIEDYASTVHIPAGASDASKGKAPKKETAGAPSAEPAAKNEGVTVKVLVPAAGGEAAQKAKSGAAKEGGAKKSPVSGTDAEAEAKPGQEAEAGAGTEAGTERKADAPVDKIVVLYENATPQAEKTVPAGKHKVPAGMRNIPSGKPGDGAGEKKPELHSDKK